MLCNSIGATLCTLKELESGCSKSGCKMNKELIWSKISDEPTPPSPPTKADIIEFNGNGKTEIETAPPNGWQLEKKLMAIVALDIIHGKAIICIVWTRLCLLYTSDAADE